MEDNREAVRLLVNALKAMPYGSKFSHGDLTAFAGKSTTENRNITTCASRLLKRYHDRTLRNIHGHGYTVEQWLTDPAMSKGYLITEVTPMDGAILISYRTLGTSAEDTTIRRSMPIDTATINFLLSRAITK